ncbi:MAG: nitrogen fixation protein NifM [Methylococcaceae bacterium]|nr:nitrogen fixation protein NifM [Methylococcaceae bacterium]
MTSSANASARTEQPQAYYVLRASLALFKKAPSELADAELSQAQRQAANEYKIETRVLRSQEASAVQITDDEVQRAFQEIRDRYDDEDLFLSELYKNQLDEAALRAALYRQCKVNTILDLIGSRAPTINDVEIGIYYHLHPQQFHRIERREACHIFISINPDYPENTEETAFIRAQEISQKLQKKPYKFADLALKHSECPTALQAGLLGTMARGTLYPELDAVLFKMKLGEISGAVKSDIGFHVLLCKSIHPAETLSLAKATPIIRQFMRERAARSCQRAWLASLPKPDHGDSGYD